MYYLYLNHSKPSPPLGGGAARQSRRGGPAAVRLARHRGHVQVHGGAGDDRRRWHGHGEVRLLERGLAASQRRRLASHSIQSMSRWPSKTPADPKPMGARLSPCSRARATPLAVMCHPRRISSARVRRVPRVPHTYECSSGLRVRGRQGGLCLVNQGASFVTSVVPQPTKSSTEGRSVDDSFASSRVRRIGSTCERQRAPGPSRGHRGGSIARGLPLVALTHASNTLGQYSYDLVYWFHELSSRKK